MVTQVVFFVSVIAVLLIVLTELALVRRMMSRHGGARWALALVLIPHAATAAIAESFLTFGNEGVLIAVLIILEGLLAVLGLGVSFLPAANRWFRRRKSEGVEAIARPNV